MNWLQHLFIAIALGIDTMVVMYHNTESIHITPLRCIINAILLSTIYLILAYSGIFIGELLQYSADYQQSPLLATNLYLFIGLTAVVCIKRIMKLFASRKKETQKYDASKYTTLIALSMASGLDIFLLYLGIGFITPNRANTLSTLIPLFVCTLTLGYIGTLFERQKTPLRITRWQILSLLIIITITVYIILSA